MYKVKKLTYLLIAILIPVFLLTGCSSSKGADSSQNKDGATLVVATISSPTKLDPQMITDIPTASILFNKIYEGLVIQDENMQLKPALATEWKRVNDTTWEFKLRQNVKFHDGAAFNAQAVKKNFDRILDPKTASPRKSLFAMLQEVKVIDDYTVQIITKYPFTPLLANLAHYAGGIISPKAIDELGEKIAQNPSGTGPFKLKEWKPGQELTLTTFNDYWGSKPKVSQVTFKVIPEDSTRLAMVETGEAHIAENVPVTDINRVTKSSNMNLLRVDAFGIDYLGFNTTKAPFNDKRIRQAINYALDKDSIISGVYNGVGAKLNGPMGPKVWGYTSDLKAYDYNINKAKELLKEAGHANGFKTTIWTNDNKLRIKLAEVIQSQLKGVGIDAQIKVLEWGAYLSALDKCEHDLFILGWSNMTGDADYNQFFLFSSETKGGAGNNTFFDNPMVDELIEKGRQESDTSKRLEIYKQAQAIEVEEVPFIVTRNQELLYATSKKVTDLWVHPANLLMFDKVNIK